MPIGPADCSLCFAITDNALFAVLFARDFEPFGACLRLPIMKGSTLTREFAAKRRATYAASALWFPGGPA
jgi:hypothetical protein